MYFMRRRTVFWRTTCSVAGNGPILRSPANSSGLYPEQDSGDKLGDAWIFSFFCQDEIHYRLPLTILLIYISVNQRKARVDLGVVQ
jgi:hypothetical protein